MNAKSIRWKADGEFVKENKSDEFDFYCCHNKLPQSEWLKTTQIYYLTDLWVTIWAQCGSAASPDPEFAGSNPASKAVSLAALRMNPTESHWSCSWKSVPCGLQDWAPLTCWLLAEGVLGFQIAWASSCCRFTSSIKSAKLCVVPACDQPSLTPLASSSTPASSSWLSLRKVSVLKEGIRRLELSVQIIHGDLTGTSV